LRTTHGVNTITNAPSAASACSTRRCPLKKNKNNATGMIVQPNAYRVNAPTPVNTPAAKASPSSQVRARLRFARHFFDPQHAPRQPQKNHQQQHRGQARYAESPQQFTADGQKRRQPRHVRVKQFSREKKVSATTASRRISLNIAIRKSG
jgi:hypothetical protein